MTSDGITRITANEQAHPKVRVLAFPFAGGSGGAYQAWQPYLDPSIEVIAYTAPGRTNRFVEPAIGSMKELVADAWAQLAPYLDIPCILFGHSLGGLLAYEFLIKYKNNMGKMPLHFISSARGAPHIKAMQNWSQKNDADFLHSLAELGGIHPDAAASPELLQLMLNTLRADIGVVEYFKYSDAGPFPCPATIFGGIDDNRVSVDDLEQWRQYFEQEVEVVVLEAAHFYLDSHAETLCRKLNSIASTAVLGMV